jgi:hypothetical protein
VARGRGDMEAEHRARGRRWESDGEYGTGRPFRGRDCGLACCGRCLRVRGRLFGRVSGRVRRWMDSTFLVMSHPMLFPFLSFFFLLARLRRSFTDVLISRGDPPICPVHEGKFGPALTEAALQPTRFQAHETQDAARLQAILPLEVAIRARQDD